MLDQIGSEGLFKSILPSDFGAYVRKPVVTFDKQTNRYDLIMLNGLTEGSRTQANGTLLMRFEQRDENPIEIDQSDVNLDIQEGFIYALDEKLSLRLSRITEVFMAKNSFSDLGLAYLAYLKTLCEPGGKYAHVQELKTFIRIMNHENETELTSHSKV